MVLGWAFVAVFVHAGVAAPASARPLCAAIARPLIAPVTHSRRDDAERLLGSESAVQLTDGQAAMLIGKPRGRDSLARTLIGRAISRLEKQRADELDHQIGSWGARDADELAGLLKAEVPMIFSPPRPFLFRAVRGFEGTGNFSAEECGDRLDIHHGSLGRNRPPPTSALIVIFLKRQPANVHTDYTVIE
ncbi:MAG TPA: hypothetical protein VGT98_04380 [Candidatus Elarobacter sp.]|nr:hypothetical protein [Candidatus Elarobacter sp.]